VSGLAVVKLYGGVGGDVTDIGMVGRSGNEFGLYSSVWSRFWIRDWELIRCKSCAERV
jgi:hypothetical protein